MVRNRTRNPYHTQQQGQVFPGPWGRALYKSYNKIDMPYRSWNCSQPPQCLAWHFWNFPRSIPELTDIVRPKAAAAHLALRELLPSRFVVVPFASAIRKFWFEANKIACARVFANHITTKWHKTGQNKVRLGCHSLWFRFYMLLLLILLI